MAKEEMLEMEGVVQEVLPNTQFRVELTNGASVLAYAGGKVVRHRIRILAGDRRLAEVKNNHQRLNRHKFAPVTTDRIRIQIDATNGSDLARIFEIRCYA